MTKKSLNNNSIKNTFENYKDFMSDFLGIFDIVKPNLNIFDGEILSSRKLLILMLDVENDMKIFDQINTKYGSNKELVDIYCLGNNGFDLFLGSGYNMLGYCNIRNDIQEDDLVDLFINIQNGVIKNKYGNVNICYLNEKNTPIEFDLFPMTYLDVEYFSKRFGLNSSFNQNIEELCIWPDSYILESDLIIQYIQHIIYGLILERKVFFSTNNKSIISKISKKINAV